MACISTSASSARIVRHVLELEPVELEVLARGEVAVAAVVLAAMSASLRSWRERQRAVGDGDAQHVGVELQIEAVLQPQRLELVLGQLAREAALHLVAELRDALARRTGGRTRRSDTWRASAPSAGNRRPALGLLAEIGAHRWARACGCARGCGAPVPAPSSALRVEQIGAGDQIGRSLPPRRALRAASAAPGSSATRHRRCRSLHSPERVRNTTTPSARRLAVSTLPVSTGLALSIFLTGAVMMLSARSATALDAAAGKGTTAPDCRAFVRPI